MIKYLLLLILPFTIYASKILSYNVYDRSDRVDVMITFDTPYGGVIKQNSTDSSIVVKLEKSFIETPKMQQLGSKFIKSISISQTGDFTQIIASVPPSVKLQASKTSDAYGLRLRFMAQEIAQVAPMAQETPNLSSLPTKKDDDMTTNYYIVMAILVVGIIALFIIKKRVPRKSNQAQSVSSFRNEPQDSKQPIIKNKKLDDASIRFQKPIGQNSNVVLLDFGSSSYLVLMGENSILLDKFTDNKPVTQNDFDNILQMRHKELSNFLTDNDTSKEHLRSYKERAASIIYDA